MPDPLFGGLTAAQFLDDYWQQKPLLVRGALPGFTTPLSPDELAGLACEDDVTARLVLERGGAYPWELRVGPFEPDDFADLPETHWSLLVQEVDRYVPAVADLLGRFRFLPNWRIDDVMVSYAPAGGGVGAHIDQYDVFLIQGLGRRRWRIDHTPVDEERLVPDLDVRVLADFEADAEWVLEPGDLLYLPPRIAHEGVALDDCMTFSVGFRAPGHAELATGLLEHLAATADPDARFADPGRPVAAHPGEIDADARRRLRGLVRGLLADDDALDRWLGTFLTQPQRQLFAEGDDADPDALADALRAGAVLRRSAVADFAHVPHADGTATLFVRGDAYDLAAGLADAAPLLTGPARLDAAALAPHLDDEAFRALLAELVATGGLRLEA